MLSILLCLVIAVADGDTITCLDAQEISHKIRLAEIDAPEKKQDYGSKSLQNLKNLIYRKQVKIQYKTKDRYGRIIGYILKEKKDINKQQLSDGMAWFYTRYGKSEAYKKAEQTARLQNKGLWSHSVRMQPWDFRKGKRQPAPFSKNASQNVRTSTKISSQNFSCSQKYCFQISSCQEAKYLLNNCGYARLDRDGDGIPCESICR